VFVQTMQRFSQKTNNVILVRSIRINVKNVLKALIQSTAINVNPIPSKN